MIDVHFPKMGMSTVELEVTEVLIEPGLRVEVGDDLLEVDTEKVTTFIQSEHAGVVREVLVVEGETYNVGDVFCRIDVD